MDPTLRRFACTQCGKCCNRSPEVQLSEASSLADVFVFRLMFRVYWLPLAPADFIEAGDAPQNAKAVYYQRKRLLDAFAARRSRVKVTRSGQTQDCNQYLTISALAVDGGSGACTALAGRRCGIYDRRPLACRTVPFHFSRPEASAASFLDAFVRTPGYECETEIDAPAVIEGGRIVDRGIRDSRAAALALAGRDRRWHAAILSRMKAPAGQLDGLPSLQYVEDNAAMGVTTASMRIAWQIAVNAGLMGEQECARLIEDQIAAIERQLAAGTCGQDPRESLLRMRVDYRSSAGSMKGASSS